MTFSESIRTCYKKYFNWNGRATRSEFWWFHLYAVLLILPLLVATIYTPKGEALHWFWKFTVVAYMLLTAIPSWMVTVRRLHDIDRTGWWYLIINIPFAGFILFFFVCQESKEPNRYTTETDASEQFEGN